MDKDIVKLGMQAEASKDYIEHILIELKERYIYEIMNDENNAEELVAYRGKLQVLDEIRKHIDYEIARGQKVAERQKKEGLDNQKESR